LDLRFSYLPMFAQVYQGWQNCFVGVRVDEDGFRIDYQMIHLSKIPSKFNYFSGKGFRMVKLMEEHIEYSFRAVLSQVS